MRGTAEPSDAETTIELEAWASIKGFPVNVKLRFPEKITQDTILRAVDTLATELALAGAERTGRAKLFFEDCQIVEDAHSPAGLLLVRFKDEAGRELSWAPRWQDLHELYDRAFTVEVINTRETGKWKEIHRFLDATRRILSKGQRKRELELLGGRPEPNSSDTTMKGSLANLVNLPSPSWEYPDPSLKAGA